jgi:ArsR family transcriptional regulator, arsenate/arsenite/antimonite-responsive transcriptional repressor
MGGGIIQFHGYIQSRRFRVVNRISSTIEIQIDLLAGLTAIPYIHKSGYVESEAAILALAGLAQSTRLDVFRLLVKHEPEGLAAGDIAKALAVPQNTMSSHLAVLSRAGLVSAQRFSRSIVYRADLARFQEVMLFMIRDCCDGRPEICAPLVENLTPCCPPKPKRRVHV